MVADLIRGQAGIAHDLLRQLVELRRQRLLRQRKGFADMVRMMERGIFLDRELVERQMAACMGEGFA